MIITTTLNPGFLRKRTDPVCTSSQGNFSQSNQIFHLKKIIRCLFCLFPAVYISCLQPFLQFLRLYVNQFHLGSIVKYGIRNPLLHHNSGYCSHHIIQAFDMLYVYSGININSCLQQFFYILIAFCMPTSLGIGMSQFINQNQSWFSLDCGIQIKFPVHPSVIINNQAGNLFQALQQFHGLRSFM